MLWETLETEQLSKLIMAKCWLQEGNCNNAAEEETRSLHQGGSIFDWKIEL